MSILNKLLNKITKATPADYEPMQNVEHRNAEASLSDKYEGSVKAYPQNTGWEADVHSMQMANLNDVVGVTDITSVNRREKKGNAAADKYVQDLANY